VNLTVNHTVTQYVQLRREAAEHFNSRRYQECQIALDVAAQYWRGMVPRERKAACQLLQERQP
jgi:type II secretory pathway component PulM